MIEQVRVVHEACKRLDSIVCLASVDGRVGQLSLWDCVVKLVAYEMAVAKPTNPFDTWIGVHLAGERNRMAM